MPTADVQLTLLDRAADALGWPSYQLSVLLSVLLVSGVCGMVGSLVVGNRMAFFSDAMSHCAFAGVSLGMAIALIAGLKTDADETQIGWLVPLVMSAFGVLVGLGIAFVRQHTGLASDTVIGVFFAGAIGLGAIMLTAYQDRRVFNPEQFLFGSPLLVRGSDLLLLFIIMMLTGVCLFFRYNQFLLASVNPSLAKSRGIAVELNNYLFIVLLALIVNFSICAVGVLLINAMLVLPAATASNVAKSMRQMFRLTLGLSVCTGWLGLLLSQHVRIELVRGHPRPVGVSGAIICLGVACFAVSLVFPYLRRRFGHLGQAVGRTSRRPIS